MEKLNFLDSITVWVWKWFDPWNYERYQYWIGIGLLPKYAIEKVMQENRYNQE